MSGHVGAEPLHVAFAWQVRVMLPVRAKPLTHEYVATCKYEFPLGSETVPFVGFESAPHAVTGHVGAEPLQSPVVKHVRVADPESVNPTLHVYVAVLL